jgi:hypothetical protein
VRGIRITVEDLETGDKEKFEITDDCCIVVAGTYFVDSIFMHANGTRQIIVKRPKPDAVQ